MKWQQVTELFPDEFVLLSILDYTYTCDPREGCEQGIF